MKPPQTTGARPLDTRRPLRATSSLLAGLVVLFGATLPAMAAGGGGGGETPWLDIIEGIFNFCIFLFVLYKFGKGPVMSFLEARSQRIGGDLAEAQRLREEAEVKLEEYSAKLDAFDAEREAILQGYRREGERERDAIIASAKEHGDRMRRDAEVAIGQDLKQAQLELKERVVEGAVEMARTTLRERVTAQTGAKLIDDYTTALGGLEDRR